MFTVHHLENSRSHRVLWLLEELELPYQVVTHLPPKNSKAATESLLKVHPLGKVPILCDKEIILCETGAIFDYLLHTYSNNKLMPLAGNSEWLLYTFWRHFIEASFVPYLAMKLVFANLYAKTPWLFKPFTFAIKKLVDLNYLDPNLTSELDYIEAHLRDHLWFAGNAFSAVDVLASFPIEAVAGRFASIEKYPNIHAFVERISKRPAYIKALARGNWSEATHAAYWAFLSK